jgi:hypothetical protein
MKRIKNDNPLFKTLNTKQYREYKDIELNTIRRLTEYKSKSNIFDLIFFFIISYFVNIGSFFILFKLSNNLLFSFFMGSIICFFIGILYSRIYNIDL